VFQQALANLPRFEWRGVPFAAWLQRIAANAIADRWQAAQRESGVPERAPASEEDIERRAMLFRLVDTLPADQRRVRPKWNEAKAPTSSFNGARCRACGNWRGGWRGWRTTCWICPAPASRRVRKNDLERRARNEYDGS
jgi:hypothetical protein